jgi:hypothetical protein
VIRTHFDSIWTDDSPQVLIRLRFAGGRRIEVLTTGQHVHLLPVEVRDSAAVFSYTTFQPALSRSMAALMPEGTLNRDRLEGSCWSLENDLENFRNGTGYWRNSEADPVQSAESAAEGGKLSFEEARKRLDHILMRRESTEEKELAERSGKVSERLLKKIPLNEVADILSRGGDPNVADECGQTALMLAASPPFDRERFRMLAGAGADLEARRPSGDATGLHLACSGGMSEAVEEWIRAGADIHARLPEGATPLMLGAKWLPIVRLLLASGARANDVDQDGHTALVYAIHGQRWIHAVDVLETIRTLIEAGTDLTLRDREGLTPLGFARRHHLSKVLVSESDAAVQEASRHVPTHEEERRRSDLMRQMLREDYPDADPDTWNDVTLADAVANLLASAGGSD